MCNQTVGLVQGAIEEAGIATVSVTLLEDVARKVRPPRTLAVPYRFGYPLGKPHDAALQRKVILQCLDLLQKRDLPVLDIFRNGG